MKISANGGADPLVRAGPPGPGASSIDKYQLQTDVGVGRGPGGPPHFAFVHPRTKCVFDGACATGDRTTAYQVGAGVFAASSLSRLSRHVDWLSAPKSPSSFGPVPPIYQLDRKSVV